MIHYSLEPIGVSNFFLCPLLNSIRTYLFIVKGLGNSFTFNMVTDQQQSKLEMCW